MIDFEKLSAHNGEFEQGGKRYVLLCPAYADTVSGVECYSAEAVSPEDVPDEGYLPCYSVRWSLLPDFSAYCAECNDIGAWIDESLACDWSSPDSVDMYDEISIDKRIYY